MVEVDIETDNYYNFTKYEALLTLGKEKRINRIQEVSLLLN